MHTKQAPSERMDAAATNVCPRSSPAHNFVHMKIQFAYGLWGADFALVVVAVSFFFSISFHHAGRCCFRFELRTCVCARALPSPYEAVPLPWCMNTKTETFKNLINTGAEDDVRMLLVHCI